MATSLPGRDGNNSRDPASSPDLHESIFVSPDAPIHDVPMRVIHRPLQSFTDENKVARSADFNSARVTGVVHQLSRLLI